MSNSVRSTRPVRVLVAIDGADSGVETAFRASVLLPTERQVVVLSVAHVPTPIVPPVADAAVGAGYASVQLEEDARARALGVAEDAVARVAQLFDADHPTRLVVIGDPGREICRVAADEHVDLVVVGSHGAGAISRLLLGSVSDHVVHHAPCPVLVLRHRDDHAES